MEAMFEIAGVLTLGVNSAFFGLWAASESDSQWAGSLYRTLSAISAWTGEVLAIGFLMRGFWLVVWVYGKQGGRRMGYSAKDVRTFLEGQPNGLKCPFCGRSDGLIVAADRPFTYLLCTSCGCQQKFDSRILCRRLPEFMNSADLLPVHARLGRALAIAKRKRQQLIELAEDLGEACWEPEGDK